MPEKLNRESKITLKGEEYTLAYDMNAMWILEEEFGINPFGAEFYQYLFGKLDENGNLKEGQTDESQGRILTPSEVIKMLYAFLNTHHEDLSKRDIAKLVSFAEFKDIFEHRRQIFINSIRNLIRPIIICQI